MTTESILNNYYNTGHYNHPDRIGYMMKMIRDLKPLTVDEWRIWYIDNVHDEEYLYSLATEMAASIPEKFGVSVAECFEYINDVMFHRTFSGYNKERVALSILRDIISPSIQEAPAEWDTQYFIDFYFRSPSNILVGIQLKPDTFFHGGYQNFVDIRGKMQAFCDAYNASAYVLTYSTKCDASEGIVFTNPEVIDEIRKLTE